MAAFSSLTLSEQRRGLIAAASCLGELVMRKSTKDLTRQFLVALALSAAAVAVMIGAVGRANAADLGVSVEAGKQVVYGCAGPRETVVFFDENGHPTVPARTYYYYCVTGTMLVPGDIPPPPEYCCG
jgi:hypothetical protein